MHLYNSLTKKKEEFVPVDSDSKQVGMYTCGQTVYDYTHIGHGRKYVGDDILRRVLTYSGYEVQHVQNVTDVGHLVSDSDEGEDKLEKGARKFGKTVWEVADFFSEHFYQSMDKLNVLRPQIICKATDHIGEQIALIQALIDKGVAYDTPEAVYFDVSKFPNYGQLFTQKIENKKTAVRDEIRTGEHKKSPEDFALWFKRVHRFADHTMHWDSPWGDGFPGWHIECSAMSLKYLGQAFKDWQFTPANTVTIDIHTGGLDHLPIHHPNEIAQSECATGHTPFVKYWVHHGWLLIEGQKMSKSLGNLIRVENLEEKKVDPMALRYLFLTVHYKRELNFTWEALGGAQKALDRLRNYINNIKNKNFLPAGGSKRSELSEEKLNKIQNWQQKFTDHISDDLDMPGAIATVWDMLKDNIPEYDKADLLMDWDQVLGLNLAGSASGAAPAPSKVVEELVKKREQLRNEKNWVEADAIRKQIEDLGYLLEDTDEGSRVKKKTN